MPPHPEADRQNAVNAFRQISDPRQHARLATGTLPRGVRLETVRQSQGALATGTLPRGAHLETVRLPRGDSASAMQHHPAPATRRGRRHLVRQRFVAVETVKAKRLTVNRQLGSEVTNVQNFVLAPTARGLHDRHVARRLPD